LFWYIVLGLVILLAMVTIHEFGHFIAGKKLGFKINEFSIGFGKSLYTRKMKDGTDFSVRLVPLGGYCAFEGEEENSENPQAFNKQAPWKRLIVLFSGAFFNFLSAIIFSVILLCAVGYDIPQINSVEPVTKIVYSSMELKTTDTIFAINNIKIDDTPLLYSSNIFQDYEAGTYQISIYREGEDGKKYIYNVDVTTEQSQNATLMAGDIIYAVNGKRIDFVHDVSFSSMLQDYVKSEEFELDKTVDLTIKRNGMELVLENVNLFESGLKNEDGNYSYQLGITMNAYKHTFGEALLRAIPFTFGLAWKILVVLFQLITGQLALSAIGGPITTITTIATFTQSNFANLFVLLPLIAANLAVFNWLPFPALDGSKMVFTIIEWIRGKPIKQEVENTIHTVGLIILFALVIIADFYQLFLA